MAQKFLDKVTKLSTLDKNTLNKLYKAVITAVQYDAFQYDGEAFHLLEGVIRKNKKGEYIFTPNSHLQALLDKADVPALLKIEESRFVDFIKLALSEIQ